MIQIKNVFQNMSNLYSLTNWTSNLPDSLSIVDTYIPGSHDSSSYPSDDGMGGGSKFAGAITQGWNYSQQLNGGIRFFDLRVKMYAGTLYTHHGIIYGESFEEVIGNQIVPFLNQNSGEIIFINLQMDNDLGNCEDGVFYVLDKYCNIYEWLATEHLNKDRTFNKNVTWGDLRQNKRRIVLIWSSDNLQSRLFGDWSGLNSTPNIVENGGCLLMSLLDADGSIYYAKTDGSGNWPKKQNVQRLFDDWSGVSATPTLASSDFGVFICLQDNSGDVYLGTPSLAKNEVESHRIAHGITNNNSTPRILNYGDSLNICLIDSSDTVNYGFETLDYIANEFKFRELTRLNFSTNRGTPTISPGLRDSSINLCMCFLDSSGSIYVSHSPDCKEWEEPVRLFGDWSGVGCTPSLAILKDNMFMCLLDSDGSIFIAKRGEGAVWPPKQDVIRLFGDWSGLSSTPTMAVCNDKLYMCRLANSGSIHMAVSTDGMEWHDAFPFLSYYNDSQDGQVDQTAYKNAAVLWNPYGDFDKDLFVSTITDSLKDYMKIWAKEKLFVLQVVDTPLLSPVRSPKDIEGEVGKYLNQFVMDLKPGDPANIIIRDFVDLYPDVIRHIIDLNF